MISQNKSHTIETLNFHAKISIFLKSFFHYLGAKIQKSYHICWALKFKFTDFCAGKFKVTNFPMHEKFKVSLKTETAKFYFSSLPLLKTLRQNANLVSLVSSRLLH